MRLWEKYFLTDDKTLSGKHFSITNDVMSYHQQLTPSPENVDDFIHWTNGYLSQKIRFFLKNNIQKHTRLLSLACGDGEHEIPLIQDGYTITLSDFNDQRLQNTMRLFPKCTTINIDILHPDFTSHYNELLGSFDVVFIPGLFYAFNNDEVSTALKNMVSLITSSGQMLITHRANNSIFTTIIDCLCKYEMKLKQLFILLLKRKKRYVFSRHIGYRRSICEFSGLLTQNGFDIVNIMYDDYYSELGRLYILRKFKLDRLFGILLRKNITYLNFFELKISQSERTSL